MTDLRRALDDAREDRVAALRAEALAHDTLHRVDVCVTCGRAARRVAVLPDAPGGDGPDDVARWTEAQMNALPLADTGCPCASAAAGRLSALAYVRACAGRGVECVYEGTLTDTWTWRWCVRPLDGVAEGVEAAALPPLSGRAAWRAVLEEGARGEPVLRAVEPGLWAFAGPREDTLEGRVKALAAGCGRGQLLPLKLFLWQPVVADTEAWTTWAAPHADAIRNGELRAGSVVDLDALRHLVRLAASRGGASLAGEDDRAVTLTRAELSRTLDLERLALTLTLRGDGLAWGAARAVTATLDLLADAEAVVAAVRAMRPAVRFTVDGWSLVPERPDGSVGPPIALPRVAGEYSRDRDALERAVRFGCDVLPAWSDPSRVCPCGAPACFVARLLPARTALALDGSDAAPVVLARWPESAPVAALVVGVGCELHTWFPPGGALAAQGLGAAELAARVRGESVFASFAFDARVVDDEGARCLLIRGHQVASAMTDDHLVAALHRACGAPLRGVAAGAVALSTSALVLHEPALPPAALDRICARFAVDADAHPGGADTFLVARDVRLDALPRGRMNRLAPGANPWA
jgi:hypothetical protein